jgi:hypothetical protein
MIHLSFLRAIFKTFQFGQAQGGAEISTTGILSVFRGLSAYGGSPNAEIGPISADFEIGRFEIGSKVYRSFRATIKSEWPGTIC